MDDGFGIRVEQDGQGPIVRVTGEIDLQTVDRLRECLLGFSDPVVTVDFRGVSFMDGIGMNALVAAQQRVRERGGKFVLYGVRPSQMRALDAVDLTTYFDSIVPD